MSNKKTSLFIVGAAKAGTTALFKNLEKHPAFYCCPIKEPHFFSNDIQTDTFRKAFADRVSLNIHNYLKKKPLEKIHQAYIRNIEEYEELFREAQPNQILTEASVSYLWSKVAARNILDYNPAAKIIILLRNPVERAFSHYAMDLRMGYTQLSFSEALKRDSQSNESYWGNSSLYVELGLYSKQVKRYREFFPETQLLIMKYEDFLSKPKDTAQQIGLFLGLEEDLSKLELGIKHNESKPPFTSAVRKVISHKAIKTIRRQRKIHSLLKPLSRLLRSSKTPFIILKEEYKYASQFFEQDIEELEKILNISLKSWKT
ncbi:MAG: sulfotransferase [Cytophagia bacterium]|nr:sulfotransferase [Cytophagia bacterium]